MKKAYGCIIALMLLSVVTLGIFLTLAPDTIPVHYNGAGEIDRWGSKYEFWLFPFFTVLMGVFMAFMAHREGKQGRESNAKVVACVGILVLVQFNALWLFFYWKSLIGTDLTGGTDLGIKGIHLLLAAVFLPLGNVMPKATRNSLYGLRTKWSMADDVCWQKSQRLGGYLLMGTGILGVILVSLLPVEWGTFALVGLLLIMAVAATVGSYIIWKKENEKSTA